MKLLISILLAFGLIACAPNRPLEDIPDMQEEVDLMPIPIDSPYCDLYIGQTFPVINNQTLSPSNTECRWDSDGPLVNSFIADGFTIELGNGSYVSTTVLRCPGAFGPAYRYLNKDAIRLSFIGRYVQQVKPVKNCVFSTNSVSIQKRDNVCYLVGTFNSGC